MKRILILTIFLLFLCSPAWAVNYYVNADADAGGDGTTWATSGAQCAFKTIAQITAAGLSTGDDVYFECGDTWTARFVINWGGSSGDQAIIGAYYGAGTLGVSGNRPIIDGDSQNQSIVGTYSALIDYSGSTGYVTIRDLKVQYSYGLGIQIMRLYGASPATSSNNLVQNCYVYRCKGSGIMLARICDSAVKDNIVEKSGWKAAGEDVWAPSVGGIYAMAMNTEGHADRNEISGNTVRDIKSEGIGMGKKTRWTLVEDNIVYDCRNVQIYAASCKYAIIRNNIVYRSTGINQQFGGQAGGAGIWVENEAEREYCYTDGNKIYDNFIANVPQGIKVTNGWQSTDSTCTIDNMHYYHNTIVDCTYNLYITHPGGDAWPGNYYHNNLSYQTDYPTSGYHFNSAINNGEFIFKNNYLNWNADPESYNITKATSGAVLMPTTDDPLVKSSGWSTIAAGAITWTNYLTSYFDLVSTSVCINAAVNLTDVNDTGGSLEDVDVTDSKWFYGGSDDPLDNYTIGTDEVTLIGVTGDNIQWTGAKTIADNDLVYYRHFTDSVPDIGAAEFTTETTQDTAVWYFDNTKLLREEISDNDSYWTDHGTVDTDAVNFKQGDASADFEDSVPEYFSRPGTTNDFGWASGGSFTICDWIRPTDLTTNGTIFQKGLAGDNNPCVSMFIMTDDSFSAYIGLDNDTWEELPHGNALTVNQWYYVCWAYNISTKATRIRIWDDTAGAILGTDYTTATTGALGNEDEAGNITVGAGPSGTTPCDVLIDNLAIYNTFLSTADMDALRTSASTIGTFSHCDSTGTQIAAETTYNAGDTCYLCVKSTTGGLYFADGPLGNLQIGTDMSYPVNEEFEYHSGIGTDTLLFYRVIQTGDRDLDLQAEGTADGTGLIHGATKLTDVGGTEITYTLPQADPAGGNVIISAPGTATDPITVGSGKDIDKISDIAYQLANEVYQYLEPITDNVDITVNGVTITGIGRTQVNTGTLTFTGDNNHVRCVNFSGAITYTGTGNTYHPVCSRGSSRMGMNPR